MFVTTKITWSLETGEVLEREGYEYSGPVDMCLGGASSGEKQNAQDALDFSQTLANEQKQVFGEGSDAVTQLLDKWGTIFAQGPYQYGFSTDEDNQLRNNIINAGAQATQNTVAATELRQQQESGGANVLPTGTNAAVEAEARELGAQQTATALGKEKELGYEVGRENFMAAGSGLAGSMAPFGAGASYAGEVAGAENASNAAQKTVDEANANSLGMKILGGVLGGAAQNAGPALSSALPGLPGWATIAMGA